MTDLTYDRFAGLLRERIPGFAGIHDEHLRDYDEVLPHVLLGELVRFLSDEVRKYGEGGAALKEAMALLEQGMGSADAKLQELVAVSFIENLDPRDESFQAIRKLFGPHLEAQYRRSR
jgi:hypothetical protein